MGAGWVVEWEQLGLFEEGEAGRPGVIRLVELEGGGYDTRREFVRKRRKVGVPQDLPDAAARGLQQGQVGNLVAPLGVNVRALHAHQRGATRSVRKDTTKAWLESEAGVEWQKERQKLFAPDEHGRTTLSGTSDVAGARVL